MPNYLTPAGHKQLADELTRLMTVERPKTVREVAEAAAQGDRSENAEYIYGKRKLAEIDRRLTYLGKRLKVLTVVDHPPADDGRVHFGAFVTIEDADGQSVRYQIVGSDETDPAELRISVDSPLAQALLGRRAGDEVLVRRPKGEIEYVVVDVSYER